MDVLGVAVWEVERREVTLDEHAFPVENVDLGIGDLSVHQQRQVDPRHLRNRLSNASPVRDAVLGVRGGACWVDLDRVHRCGPLGCLDLGRRGPVR